MKKTPAGIFYVLTGLILLLSSCFSPDTRDKEHNQWLQKAVQTAIHQLKAASEAYTPGASPRSIQSDGRIRLAYDRDWTCGFFPGSLWLGYAISGDSLLRNKAEDFTEALDSVQYFTYTHDVGFMVGCSFLNGYKLTGNKAYLKAVKNATASLLTRYNPTVGCFRSWDFGQWEFPVIIDNMMNLELIFWSADHLNQPQIKEFAVSHALQTMKNHYRSDFSSYHLVDYDTLTGQVLQRKTFQGYADESAWARGQAWGLYGFTMAFRETGDSTFLREAENIAAFIMNHPHLPKDKVPYWDFDAPKIPDALRDASAGAVIASALLELSTLTDRDTAYLHFAADLLKSLSGPKYLAEEDNNGYFILKHSVGSFPNHSEVDTPINYADYYYLEALLRYGQIKNIDLGTFITPNA